MSDADKQRTQRDDITAQDNHSPAPPQDGITVMGDNHSPVPPQDGITVMGDNHSPTPPQD